MVELGGVTVGVGLLLESVSADDLRVLLSRTGHALAPVLERHPGLPLPLVDKVLGSGNEVMISALANNPEFERSHRALWEERAFNDDPAVGKVLYRHYRSSFTTRCRILAAARPETAGWTAANGLVTELVQSPQSDLLRAAVVCAFPDLVRHSLRMMRSLSPAQKLRAVLSLNVAGKLDQTLPLLREVIRDPEMIRLATDAAASTEGAERLRKATVEAETTAANGTQATASEESDINGTNKMIEEFYRIADDPEVRAAEDRRSALQHVNTPYASTLDWTAIRAAHRTRAFHPEAAAVLLHKDCPDEIAAELMREHPRGLALLIGAGRQISAETVRAMLRTTLTAETLPMLLKQRLGRDISAADLLTEIQPARLVLKLAEEHTATDPERAERQDDGEDGRAAWDAIEQAEWETFRDRLTELVTGRLAGNVSAWRALRAKLSKFDGSVTELIDQAVAQGAAGGRGPAGRADSDKKWPDGDSTPSFIDSPSLHVNRAAYLMLLNCASTDTQWTLLPHLDDRTRYDLLARGQWRDEWLTRALADDDRPTLVLLSRHVHLSAETIETLASLDDPKVNAALIYQRHVTDEQRHKLVTGTPFTPGRSGWLPMDADLRALVLAEWRGGKPAGRDVAPHWLGPMLYSRDPKLVRHCLERLVPAQNWVLRVMLNRWERDGRDGLLELLPDTIQKGVRTLLTELVNDPDSEAALRRLRDAVHDAESPKKAAQRLRGGTSPENLLAEGFRWDWETLLAEHRINPFDNWALGQLRAMKGCPPALGRAVTADLSTEEKRAVKALVAGKPPATVLAKTPVRTGKTWRSDTTSWVLHSVRCGVLASVDVIHHARPAASALDPDLADDAYRAELAALVDKHLTGKPERLMLALALLPDFTGTVPELIRSAALAAG